MMRISIFMCALILFSVGLIGPKQHRAVRAAEHSPDVIYAVQGWTDSERKSWYAATQGSRLMPASWFKALETADSETLFNSKENMRRFRFMFDSSNPNNPYPIGFAEDKQSDLVFEKTKLRWISRGLLSKQGKYESWIGLNCSACHTAELRVGKTRFRVDGGPALIDFQSFEEEIARALRRTLDNDTKFNRFAERVSQYDKGTKFKKLRTALAKLTVWRETVIAANHTELRSGYSRLDAFGHIFNQVALFANVSKPRTQGADAPVSFPFLWNTPQHDFVQWNGIAKNGPRVLGIDVGALGRNTGEVVGVFGEVNVKKRTGSKLLLKPRAVSSASVNNLIELERHVARLKSPQWPIALFGELDVNRVNRGSDLFKGKCQSCHNDFDRNDLETTIKAQMSFFQKIPNTNNFPSPGTDPSMACRSAERVALSGAIYKGAKYTDEFEEEHQIEDVENVSTLLTAMVRSALFDQVGELLDFALPGSDGLIIQNPGNYSSNSEPPKAVQKTPKRKTEEKRKDMIEAVGNGPFKTARKSAIKFARSRDWGPFNECMTTNPSKLKGYKARPLNGIWATAPYLHNGSIPNLYELLLPPEKRVITFYTGSYQFDPKNVGYVTTKSAENSFRFDVFNGDGSVKWGNFNGGHDYGNALLTKEQRLDLVEYMKSL